jgi:hypothetical protein
MNKNLPGGRIRSRLAYLLPLILFAAVFWPQVARSVFAPKKLFEK